MTTETEDDPWQVDRKIEGPVRGPALVCLSRNVRNRPVVYFGLNKSAHVESEILRLGNAARGGVTNIINADYTDEMTVRRTESSKVRQLVSPWCLPPTQAESIVDLIEQTVAPRAKLLLLVIAEVYAEAETGRREMDRVMLSGESLGSGLHSNDHERAPVRLDFSDFVELSTVFPVAARKVKHLLVSACNAGFPENMTVYREMFPRVHTIMAYASKCPDGRGRMARSDIEYWLSCTARAACRSLAPIKQRPDPKHPKGGPMITVATWSAFDEKYRVYEIPLPKLLAKIRSLEPKFKARLVGEIEPGPPPGAGVVEDYFRYLTDLVGREAVLEPKARSAYVAIRKQAMRLRYWNVVRARFGSAYRTKLDAGFFAARMATPQFAVMKRSELLRRISELKVAPERDDTLTSDQRDAIAEVLRLMQGLYDLDDETVPQEWLE